MTDTGKGPRSVGVTEPVCFEVVDNSEADETGETFKSETFDLMTFRDHGIEVIRDDFGNKKEIETNERYYVPGEISWLLKSLGYRKIEIFSGKGRGVFQKRFIDNRRF